MTNNRSDQRVNYVSECLLDVQSTSYFCLLENISSTGASLEMIGDGPKNDQCGEECKLTVLLLSPVKYSCKILRINSFKIALKFLDH